MESIAQRLKASLPSAIQPAGSPRSMPCIAQSNPGAFWAEFLDAIINKKPCALINPAWPKAWKDRLALKASQMPARGEPAILVPTSGSSRFPKFCIHDLDTLKCAATGYAQRFGKSGIIHAVSVLPQHHVGGFMPAFRSAECGGQIHFADYRDATTIRAAPFPLEQACLSVVPTQLGRMLQDKDLLALLKAFGLIFTGGAACPANLLEQARKQGLRLAPCYGSTETAAMVTAMDPEAFANGAHGVGTLLPHARIVIDQQSQILVHSGANLRNYLPGSSGFSRKPFDTGDYGSLDASGHLKIMGRSDRIIITGGENVHPERVEAAALETGMVTMARCEARPDSDWGQRIELTVVASSPDADSGRLMEAMKRRLPAFAVPKDIHFVEKISANHLEKFTDSDV